MYYVYDFQMFEDSRYEIDITKKVFIKDHFY